MGAIAEQTARENDARTAALHRERMQDMAKSLEDSIDRQHAAMQVKKDFIEKLRRLLDAEVNDMPANMPGSRRTISMNTTSGQSSTILDMNVADMKEELTAMLTATIRAYEHRIADAQREIDADLAKLAQVKAAL